MGILSSLESISEFIPEVKKPTQRKLSFKEKLKWTLAILAAFFVLSLIPLYGLGGNSFQQFEFLSVILGASFGSILSLGIGPIVTASIVRGSAPSPTTISRVLTRSWAAADGAPARASRSGTTSRHRRPRMAGSPFRL